MHETSVPKTSVGFLPAFPCPLGDRVTRELENANMLACRYDTGHGTLLRKVVTGRKPKSGKNFGQLQSLARVSGPSVATFLFCCKRGQNFGFASAEGQEL